jgi:hypothetical protein
MWVMFDYIKYEFVFLFYNLPYTYYLYYFISFLNIFYSKVFSVFNTYRFEPTTANIIPFMPLQGMIYRMLSPIYNFNKSKIHYFYGIIFKYLMGYSYLVFSRYISGFGIKIESLYSSYVLAYKLIMSKFLY